MSDSSSFRNDFDEHVSSCVVISRNFKIRELLYRITRLASSKILRLIFDGSGEGVAKRLKNLPIFRVCVVSVWEGGEGEGT